LWKHTCEGQSSSVTHGAPNAPALAEALGAVTFAEETERTDSAGAVMLGAGELEEREHAAAATTTASAIVGRHDLRSLRSIHPSSTTVVSSRSLHPLRQKVARGGFVVHHWVVGMRFAFVLSCVAGAAASAFACSPDTASGGVGSADGGALDSATLGAPHPVDGGRAPTPSEGNCMDGIATNDLVMQPWTPPASPQNVCTANDVSAFAAGLKVPDETFTELKASLSVACAACVFSAQTDTHWGLWVEVPSSPGSYMPNQGACYADAVGGSAACGEAMFRETTCFDEVCGFDACAGCATRAFAQDGQCAPFAAAVKSACGANAALLDAQCVGSMPLDGSRFLLQMQLLCANANPGTTADAGADGATDAAEGGT
jgi:hypothetical protein